MTQNKLTLTNDQKTALRNVAGVEFTTPPAGQGQIVEVSYGCSEHHIYVCRHDRSDNSVQIVAYTHVDDADFAPWNGKPALGERVGLIYDGPRTESPVSAQ